MKKFTSLILVVAMLAGVACTTDVTEDLTIGIGGKTELTVSLEGSRIALGDKVDGEYQALWSEGDKISINGIVSEEAAISADNPAKASFSFEGALATPYNVVYPAAAAGKVVFASEQSFVNGTFSAGATPMYGYSESASGVTLHHLAGVLKIGVTGSKTLTYAQVSTIDRAPIAGVFDIDCATGEVAPSEGATEIVSYSFGEGLALSGEAQYIHLAVPAGVYNELYVTLYDSEGGVMYATVKATDEKPLNAGAVREFKTPIPYAATDEVFVIKDVASLQEFKAAVEADTPLAKNAIFVADVDLSEVDWVSINGDKYEKTILGNGYAIKGLKAPLFNKTSASFKGLHLRDVNLVEAVNPNVGGLARSITATDTASPSVENCSATGSFTVNCTEFVYDDTIHDEYTSFAIGGLVGSVYGVSFTDCHNEMELTVSQVMASTTATKPYLYPWVGGVVGLVEVFNRTDESVVLSNIYRCENDGDVRFEGNSFTADVVVGKVAPPLRPYIGGVVGGVAGANLECTVQDIVNRGDVTLSGKLGNGLRVSGTIGYLSTTHGSNFTNYGKVSCTSGTIYGIYVAGGVGYCTNGSNLDNVQNYGEVYFGENVQVAVIVAGGLIAFQGSDGVGKGEIKNSCNHADVTILCNQFLDHTVTSTFYYRVGGLSGWTQNRIDNCVNNGKVTCRSNLYNNDDAAHSICVAGLVGYKTVDTIINSTNEGEVIIDVNLGACESADVAKVRMNAGGIAGYCHLPISNTTNNANVTASGSYVGDLRLAGLVGHQNTTNSALPLSRECVNNGTITIADNVTVGNLLEFGGCFGYSSKFEDCTNNGDIIINKVSVTKDAFIGGVSAYASANTTNVTNKGNVTIKDEANFAGPVTLGGLVGHHTNFGATFTNEGAITIGKATIVGVAYISGGIGYCYHNSTTNYVEGVINRGNITSKANHVNAAAYYAGCGAYFYEGSKYTAVNSKDWQNYGALSLTGNIGAGTSYVCGVGGYIGGNAINLVNHESGTVYIAHPSAGTNAKCHAGGVIDAVKGSATDLTNYADITVEGVVGHTLYGSAAIVSSYNYDRTNVVNYGNYTINAKIGTNCFVGGLMYDCGGTSIWKNCHNYGDIVATANTVSGGQIRLGGLFAKMDNNKVVVLDGCSNSGDIINNGTGGTYLHFGSIMGGFKDGSIVIQNGFKNSGDIINRGKSTYDISNKTTRSDIVNYSVCVGGLYGCLWGSAKFVSTDYPEWTGEIINEGRVIDESQSDKNNIFVGGIYGAANTAELVLAEGATLINKGDVKLGGTYVAGGLTSVGGFAAYPATSVDGVQVMCNVEALDVENVGMIYGVARTPSTLVATNCKLAGMIATGYNDNGDANWVTLKESNYHEYIYADGKNTDWTGTENWDGCTFVSSLE